MTTELKKTRLIMNNHSKYYVTCSVLYILMLTGFFLIITTIHSFKTIDNTSVSVYKPIDTNNLVNPELVKKFYSLRNQQLLWFTTDSQSHALRKELITLLIKGDSIGLKKEHYHFNYLLQVTYSPNDLQTADKVFTDAALTFAYDIFKGNKAVKWIRYDALTPKYIENDNSFLLNNLINTTTVTELRQYFSSLEPLSEEYHLMKLELRNKLQQSDSLQNIQQKEIQKLRVALDFYRWINHFRLDRYIVVNIPSATLRYYEKDSLKLKMRIVAGKASTPTPIFTCYCNEVILYPYWNVPQSIAINELLPLFTIKPILLDALNMQVIDKSGNLIDPKKIKWNTLSKRNFPYKFRQSTGCDNALGVMKFNLVSPYSVYLHDTNLKSAFKSENRYFSHGCIRIEEPLKLANNILDTEIDSTFLQSCLKNQQPITLTLSNPVPVFVIYMPVEADNKNEIRYFNDVYSLLH